MSSIDDALSASVSKSMTVDKLQKSLKKANVEHSGLKKAALVSLFISNRLHEGSKIEIEAKEIPIQKEETKEETKEEEKEEAKSKQELIISFTISGHGCEDILYPWPDELPISQYFRNNVRVYSKACVPDVNSIGSITGNIDVLKKIQRKFADVPKAETAAIISAYADEVRHEYKDEILHSTTHAEPGFEKMSMPENMDRMSNLITFLANKHFGFYHHTPNEKISENYQIQQYKGLGIQVTDIRLKITNPDGTVSYSQIFSPMSFQRADISSFNLIYKEGMTYIVKDILKRKDLVKPALQIFGFTGKKDRIMDITLEQIYELMRLLNVDYVNIMDFTCRACSIGRIPQSLTNDIYNREQQYSRKATAFGKSSDMKRHNKSKRLKRSKRSTRRK